MIEVGAAFIKRGGETGALYRSIDWSRSRLGPASAWPQSLRTAVSMCVGSRFPIALYWGEAFVMLYNDALIPLIGFNKHPEALGRPVFDVLPEVRDQLEPLFAQVVASGEATLSEDLMLPLIREDAQQEAYFTFTYSPIHIESGEVGGVFCAAIETTDKVIEGRRLRLLNALANGVHAPSLEVACIQAAAQLTTDREDLPFALLYLFDQNEDLAHLAGAANVEPGQPCAPKTVARSDGSLWAWETGGAAVREISLSGGPHGARGAVVLPIERVGGGQPFGFLVSGLSPLLRPSSSYSRFLKLLAGSISQIASNAAAYQEERERAEALAKLDRAKTTFFSNVSHEFRTPLTLMLAPIQDLRSLAPGAVPDAESVELLHRNSQRLLKLVNTLLDFSRIEAGRVYASYEPLELSTLTADLASSFRATIERAGLEFVVDCPAVGEAYVDRDMWEKIVLNLLSNAYKFTFEGRISVRIWKTERDFHLEVADTGTGIAAVELPRLFERFHRIEGSRSRSHEGSGIGLALVRELVRLHGGEIHVQSILGEGTRFEIQIPRGKGHVPADSAADKRLRPARKLGTDPFVSEAMRWAVTLDHQENGSSDRPRIIVADDNADMREYIAKLLSERWRVETFADGSSALSAIRADPPALVVTDVMMPGISGFELVREMRSSTELRGVPVVILSARAGEDDTAEGFGSGATDYIAKPFSARELLLRVASALESTRIADDMRRQRDNVYRHFVQAPFPIAVLLGSALIIELANAAILRAWGKSAVVLGRPLRDAIPELEGQPFLGQLAEVLATGIPCERYAALARFPTGHAGEFEDRYYNFIYAPLRDLQGKVEGILVSAFDVSSEVAARNEQLRLAEFQERFVAVLGHDLRNPLAALTMATGLLREHASRKDDAFALRVLSRVTSSSTRMSRMVEQVLDLSRTRIGGGLQVIPKPIDVRSVLVRVIDELRVACPDQRVELRAPSLRGEWDPDRLEQVFSNLIGNALNHGSTEQAVTVTASDEADRIAIEVHNFGHPIPEAIRADLFTPFRRGDRDSREAKTAGLGLGLYIAREIIEGHAGTIDVVSNAVEGTTFRVTLPRKGRTP